MLREKAINTARLRVDLDIGTVRWGLQNNFYYYARGSNRKSKQRARSDGIFPQKDGNYKKCYSKNAIISKMMNYLDRLISRPSTVKERISELKDKSRL